jgi:hypothetical protein
MQYARRLAWILALVASFAAVAAVFGPTEAWGGVDLGATGAALLMLTLGGAIWLFAARADEVFPEHMSLAERRAWVGLAFAILVVAIFARHMWAMSLQDLPPNSFRDPVGRHLMRQILPLMICWGVIAHLLGRQARGVEVDERDLRLLDRAHQAGDSALMLIVIAGVLVLAFVPGELLAWWLAPIALAHVLIGVIIAKAFVEQVALAFAYRRQRV